MENLRESSRVDAQHFISYDVFDDKGQIMRSGMALSRNLSRKGVEIESRDEFPENAQVRLHLAVEDEIVDLDGIVRHVQKISEDNCHIGIEFEKIEEEIIQKVAQFYPAIFKNED